MGRLGACVEWGIWVDLSGLSAKDIVRRSCCLKGYSLDSMTSKELKLHRNEHAVRSRKKLSIFGTGRSACLMKDQFTSEHFSEPIGNHVIPNELWNLNLYEKHLQKRYRIFRRDRELNSISARTLQRLRNKSRKVREFVVKRICSSTPKSPKCLVISRLGIVSLNSLKKYVKV